MPRISFRLPVLLATPVHCLQQREVSRRLSISSSTMAVAYLICTTIIWLHCWKCYSCILRPYRFNYWMPSLNPPTHTHPPLPALHAKTHGISPKGVCPPLPFGPVLRSQLKGGGRGAESATSPDMRCQRREKESNVYSSLQQLPVFQFFLSLSVFLAVNVSSESLFTKNEKKRKKYILHWPRSLHPSVFFSF